MQNRLYKLIPSLYVLQQISRLLGPHSFGMSTLKEVSFHLSLNRKHKSPMMAVVYSRIGGSKQMLRSLALAVVSVSPFLLSFGRRLRRYVTLWLNVV